MFPRNKRTGVWRTRRRPFPCGRNSSQTKTFRRGIQPRLTLSQKLARIFEAQKHFAPADDEIGE
jgi:hypothetical protein